MAGSVLLYDEILEKGETPDYIIAKFDRFNSSFAVLEYYCVNAGCNCTDVLLKFMEISKDGTAYNEWFSMRLDLYTWEVTEKTALKKMIKVDEMVEEFMKGIEGFKSRLRYHFDRAKEYGRHHFLSYVSTDVIDLILDGKMIEYSEIFGNQNMGEFEFKFNGEEEYFIADQYCSNPKCLCNEAILVFYRIDPSKATQESEFAVRMNLKKFAYEIEDRRCSAGRVEEVIGYVRQNKPETLNILRKRYSTIKSAAKEIIKECVSKAEKEETKVKVGRNDPCPCGSGKKYKLCCGK